MSGNHPFIIPNKHILAMATSGICGLYGAIKLKAIAYSLLTSSLGFGGFIASIGSVPFTVAGAILGFGLFVQACKYCKAWPMDLDTSNPTWGLNLFSVPTSRKDKLTRFFAIFISDSKSALRSFDRSLLESLSNYFVEQNSPEYKEWIGSSSYPKKASETQAFWGEWFQGIYHSANQGIKDYITKIGLPAVAQLLICKKIHEQSVHVWHGQRSRNMQISPQALDAESTQAAILTMYNYSLSDKGLLETTMSAAYAEYQNPPILPVVSM